MAGRGVHREDSSQDADGDTTLTGTITLPGVERSVALARRFVRETLGPRHLAMDKAALGVSELTTNAIAHTPSGDGGQVTIGIIVTVSLVRVEVTNEGTVAGKLRIRRDTDAENGRGILIVDALADAWGISESCGTTTVWAEFRTASWSLPRPDLMSPRRGSAPSGQSRTNQSARNGPNRNGHDGGQDRRA